MTDLRIYLENILQTLRNDVRPAAGDERSRAAISAIEQIVARMIVNAQGVGTEEELSSLVSPVAHFGGTDRLKSVAQDARQAFATGGSAAVRGLLEWERGVISRVHMDSMALIDAQSAAAGAPSIPSPSSTSLAALESYLRRRLNAQDTRVVHVNDVFGGRSKITSLVTLSGCPGLPDEVVLRRDAAMNLTGGTSVTSEFPLLCCLHEFGVPVPKPFIVEPDASVLGGPFMLVERVAGQVGRIYHSPPSVKLMRAVAAALATLHRVPLDAIAARAGRALEPLTRDALAAQIDDAEAAWYRFGGPLSVSTTIAFEWLRRNLERAFQGAPCLVHGDVLFHNILFEGGELRALLDWELARVSYPAADLGYILPAVCRVMPWEDFMAAYRSAGGADVPQDAVDFYSIWSNLYMSKLSAQVIHLVRQRQLSDVTLTAVCMHDVYVWGYDLAQHLLRTADYS